MNNYLIKNFPLAVRSEWMIEDDTSKAIKEVLPEILTFGKSQGTDNSEVFTNNLIWDLLDEPLQETYTIPLFKPEFCEMLLDEVENMKLYFNFTPNPEEDELRQIPEIILEQFAPDIFLSMMSVVYSVMNPIFMVLWQRYIETAYSIQIANYNLKDKQQGAWHHDQTADISVVVPLNTGDYKGGGTEFMGRGTIKPLPSGHALIFPSFTHMHRGLTVDKGDRYLLVFWLKTAIPV
jgi:hypothetical protein